MGTLGLEKSAGKEEVEPEPVAGNRVWDPYQQRWVTRDEETLHLETVDTVQWRDGPVTGRPPVIDKPSGDPFAPTYRPEAPALPEDTQLPEPARRSIAYILPFLGASFDPTVPVVPANAQWALHFWAGAQLALDSLARAGIELDVSVFDSEASPEKTGQLLASQPVFQASDLVIGPYRREVARLLAESARQWGVPLVSPYTASDDIARDNPYYLQVNPSLSTHCFSLANHALGWAGPEELVLVARRGTAELPRLAYFQQAHYVRAGTRNVPSLRELHISDTSADLQDLKLAPVIRRGGTTVFMIPSVDETFVYSFLRKLDLATEPEDTVRVYGLPQWADFEYIDIQYLQRLNVHISSSFYVDPDTPWAKRFLRRFLDAYGAIPRPEAYLGYDVTLYFGRMAYYFGRDAAQASTGRPADLLHTEFHFEPVIIPTTTGAEGLPAEQYENKFVQILKFQDYGFMPAF